MEGYGIDTITLTCRLWAIIKHMSKMTITAVTQHFRSTYTETVIWFRFNTLVRDWRPKARPARMRVIFRIRRKEFVPATRTHVYALLLVVHIFTCKGSFGSFFSKYVELVRRKDLFPILFQRLCTSFFVHLKPSPFFSTQLINTAIMTLFL